MSPPDLSADAPIADVLQPLGVNFFPMRGEDANEMITHHGERFVCFWIPQEPLLANAGFDRHIAAIAESNIVFIRLGFRQCSPRLQ